MITEKLSLWENFDFENFLSSVDEDDVRPVIQKDCLSELDLLTLISPASDSLLEEMAVRAGEITERQFGKTISLYTPLYLSDYCRNRCLYCGFNSGRNMDRRKLSISEIRKEGETISLNGLEHILILTGGDRDKTPPSYIAEAVGVLKPLFSSISIEVYALSEEEYGELVRCGADQVTIYQETYDRDLYGKMHLEGEKSDYDFRIHAPERAATAGARSVNLGVLLGLGDPLQDFFKASLHCNYIRKKYPGVSVAMSFPRIRRAAGGFQPRRALSDRELVRLILAFRLYMPRGEISISTRESAALRNNLLPLGVTKMSADSRTAVGGRTGDGDGNEQFLISDRRSVAQLDLDLRRSGFQPVYKDWVRV